MAKTTVIFGVLLIALGMVGYLGSTPTEAVDQTAAAEDTDTATADGTGAADASPGGKRSVTALIPAVFGGLLALFGLVAMNEKMRMHAMHGAVLVGLFGTLAGAGRGFMGLGKFMADDPTLNKRSFAFVWIMAILCAIFVFLCVRSFIDARKQRQAAEAQAAG